MNDDEFLTELILSSNSTSSNRKKTFLTSNLPFTSPTVDSLVDAGFYYQSEDAVQCWACGIVLDGWEPDDDPLEQHKEHSPDCPIFTLPDRNNPTLSKFFEIKVALFKKDILQNYFPYANQKYRIKVEPYKHKIRGVAKRLKKQDH